MIDIIYPLFHQKPVYIIGGGPSLKGFDFSKLDDKLTVAVNSSFKFLKNPTMIYWMDSKWLKQNKEEVKANPAQWKATSYMWTEPSFQDFYQIYTEVSHFPRTIGEVFGNNAGTQALSLVMKCRPSQITLLGFDMCNIDGASHFHDEYNN